MLLFVYVHTSLVFLYRLLVVAELCNISATLLTFCIRLSNFLSTILQLEILFTVFIRQQKRMLIAFSRTAFNENDALAVSMARVTIRLLLFFFSLYANYFHLIILTGVNVALDPTYCCLPNIISYDSYGHMILLISSVTLGVSTPGVYHQLRPTTRSDNYENDSSTGTYTHML
jgi:hypothetical protein